jgi:hypothetical protein
MFDIDEAPCLERLLFHFTMFKLMEIRLFESPAKGHYERNFALQISGNILERKNVDALKSEAAKHLNRCLCIAKGRYRQLEKVFSVFF